MFGCNPTRKFLQVASKYSYQSDYKYENIKKKDNNNGCTFFQIQTTVDDEVLHQFSPRKYKNLPHVEHVQPRTSRTSKTRVSKTCSLFLIKATVHGFVENCKKHFFDQ